MFSCEQYKTVLNNQTSLEWIIGDGIGPLSTGHMDAACTNEQAQRQKNNIS